MCHSQLEQFTLDIIKLISNDIADNLAGVRQINSEYWFGRLSDSIQLKKEIKLLISKYMNEGE